MPVFDTPYHTPPNQTKGQQTKSAIGDIKEFNLARRTMRHVRPHAAHAPAFVSVLSALGSQSNLTYSVEHHAYVKKEVFKEASNILCHERIPCRNHYISSH